MAWMFAQQLVLNGLRRLLKNNENKSFRPASLLTCMPARLSNSSLSLVAGIVGMESHRQRHSFPKALNFCLSNKKWKKIHITKNLPEEAEQIVIYFQSLSSTCPPLYWVVDCVAADNLSAGRLSHRPGQSIDLPRGRFWDSRWVTQFTAATVIWLSSGQDLDFHCVSNLTFRAITTGRKTFLPQLCVQFNFAIEQVTNNCPKFLDANRPLASSSSSSSSLLLLEW